MNRYGIVYKRAARFMRKIAAIWPVLKPISWRDLRALMIQYGLASDKLTIKAYRERLEIFGFIEPIGRSGKFLLYDPDIAGIQALESFMEKKAVVKEGP